MQRQDVLAVICLVTALAAGGFAAYTYFADERGTVNFAFMGSRQQPQQPKPVVQGSSQPDQPVSTTATLDHSPTPATFVGPQLLTDERIDISLKDQELSYYNGALLVGTFKISSGVSYMPTPTGTYSVIEKIPVHEFKGTNRDGTTYDFPNTKYNLLFHAESGGGNLYIHGAYWNHHIGTPQSHGCINVSYANMESLYPWAVVGATVTIE